MIVSPPQDIKIFNDTDQQILFAYGLSYNPSVWQQAPGLTGNPGCARGAGNGEGGIWGDSLALLPLLF